MGGKVKGKHPTRKQKEFIKAKGLNPDKWLVLEEYGLVMVIENKSSGKTRTIAK